MKWRIAKVLLNARFPGVDGLWSPAAIAQAKKEALLVLEAMRKPTKNMLRAGYVGCDEHCYGTALGAWDSMIECAITGATDGTDWPDDDKYLDEIIVG